MLRLGQDLGTVTLLHYAEYLTPISGKPRVRRHRLVAGRDHPELRVVECLDDCDGIVDYPGDDYFEDILRDYLAARQRGNRRRRPSNERADRSSRHRVVRRDVDGRAPGRLSLLLDEPTSVSDGDDPRRVVLLRFDPQMYDAPPASHDGHHRGGVRHRRGA